VEESSKDKFRQAVIQCGLTKHVGDAVECLYYRIMVQGIDLSREGNADKNVEMSTKTAVLIQKIRS
jgi:hypothetical protein